MRFALWRFFPILCDIFLKGECKFQSDPSALPRELICIPLLQAQARDQPLHNKGSKKSVRFYFPEAFRSLPTTLMLF